MRSGRRIKVSVPLQRFQPLRIPKVKGKFFKKYIFLDVYILMYVLILTVTIIEW